MVNKAVIKNRIAELIKDNKSEEDVEKAAERFAEELSTIIVDAIKSGTVNVTIPIIPVQVVVPAGTGASLAPIKVIGSIS
ncbi:hypothetical protein EOM86_02970 [Candidatus Nomurabacteria bacterium]|nr:hypothetical protein [Candidatus Nomurabacteria bacterium]